MNVAAWSPCGRFLAAGAIGGLLTIWDVNSRLVVERCGPESDFLGTVFIVVVLRGEMCFLQAEAWERIHGVQLGLASIRQPDRLHGHRGLPGPAGRTRHLRYRYQLHQGTATFHLRSNTHFCLPHHAGSSSWTGLLIFNKISVGTYSFIHLNNISRCICAVLLILYNISVGFAQFILMFK